MKTQPSKELATSKKPLPPQLKPQVSIGAWINSDIEKELYLAQYEKKIAHFQTNDEVNNLLKVVTTWRIYLGIREEASKEENVLNVNFIRENYKNFTLADIELAYKYALTGKLEVDAEAYGKFSPLYISKILNAYGFYCEKMMTEILKRKREHESRMRQLPVHESYDERLENRKKSIVWYYHQLRSSYKYVGDYGSVVWTFLTRNNIVNATNIDFDIAKEEAKKMRIAHTLNIFARVLEKMTTEERQKEYDTLDEMYGKYFVMQQFFTKVDNIDEWLKQFTDEQFIPKKK
jgi:hypothetical protein